MKLSLDGLRDRNAWEAVNIALPQFDVAGMRERTLAAPAWLHLGAGNLFRAFPCAALQTLLEDDAYDRGVIACETFDPEILQRAYRPCDVLSLLAVLRTDGRIDKRVIASVSEVLETDSAGMARLQEIIESPSLQLISFTVTEKAYVPENPMLSILCVLLNRRFESTGKPLALLSLDNCSENGDVLRRAIDPLATAMVEAGKASDAFLPYMRDSVTYPLSMIDKITPHPDPDVGRMLTELGVEGMDIIHTSRGSVTAAFVNAEQAEYLVIEDAFPNGRPPFELAGIHMTDRETVKKAERMKVKACLNPLHTALAVLGCLLGYEKVSREMSDPDIRRFIEKLGYGEMLPVCESPGIIDPHAFLDEAIGQRISNPFLPDTPQRIATDTSQKIPVRFGDTVLRAKDPAALVCVPFVMAAWLRYLSGVDDAGNAFTPSPDPRLEEIRARLSEGLSDALLGDETLFGADLVKAGLAGKVRQYYAQMSEGNGAVRRALRQAIGA